MMACRVWASVVAALLVCASARAQALGSERMPVVVRSTDGTALRIQGEGLAKGAGLCFRSCTLNLAPGTYTVSFPSGGTTTFKPFTVTAPSEVVVNGGSAFRRGLGLALIIGGGTVLSAGAIVAYADLELSLDSETNCRFYPDQCYRRPSWVVPAEIAGGVGLGVAVTGIVLFLTAKPSVEVSALTTAASQRPSVFSRLRVMPELGARRSGARLEWSF